MLYAQTDAFAGPAVDSEGSMLQIGKFYYGRLANGVRFWAAYAGRESGHLKFDFRSMHGAGQQKRTYMPMSAVEFLFSTGGAVARWGF